MTHKILTRHPQGKKGVHIDAGKYNLVRDTLMRILRENGQITYRKMNELAVNRLKDNFEGSVSWYVVTVKLDLEANGIIERIPGTSPHEVKLRSQ